MVYIDPLYFLFVAPALLIGLWAQFRVHATFAEAERVVAPMTGAQAARIVLDSAGLESVGIEPVEDFLSDHYDPRSKALRLSPQVFQGQSIAAVGIAAHEAGHAIQDAQRYAPLVVRNAAVPLAAFGGGVSWILILLGAMISTSLLWAGIAAFTGVVFFQLANLPVEFDASLRAKEQLATLGIVGWPEQKYVCQVLDAAAWTYVAGTLQAILTLAYLLFRLVGLSDNE